ncbi:MAG: TetR/AcrR family transcriptional regulator [Bacteroidota bacterium]
MGIAERKERERQEMRSMILSTAAQLFIEEGFEKTSIRNIAEAIEYSPATIYLYFKDKNELFHALSEEGFRKFFTELNEANQSGKPMDRMKRLGKQYLKFAIENPGYYDLMFIMKAPMESHHNDEGWDLGMKSHGILTSLVKECIDDGYFKSKDAKLLSFMIWSFVHGAVSFKIRDRMKMYEELDQDELMSGALDYFNEMLEKL